MAKIKFSLFMVALAVADLLAYCSYTAYTLNRMSRPYGDRGKIFDAKEISNGHFKVRVNAHCEEGVYLGGAYWVFNSARVGSDDWREFYWHRLDDPHPAPSGMFRFVADRVGYIYDGLKLAVTTDAGSSWHYWEPLKELPQDWRKSYRYIKEIRIDPSGTGEMFLLAFDRENRGPRLQTQDYGRHWSGE